MRRHPVYLAYVAVASAYTLVMVVAAVATGNNPVLMLIAFPLAFAALGVPWAAVNFLWRDRSYVWAAVVAAAAVYTGNLPILMGMFLTTMATGTFRV